MIEAEAELKLTDPVADPDVPGLLIWKNFIDPSIEPTMLARILKMPLTGVTEDPRSRRVVHYGYKYDYRKMARPTKVEDIPVWLKMLADLPGQKLLGVGKFFDQLVINEYFPGQGIAPHVDHPQQFGDVIFCICLNSGIGIDFNYPSGQRVTKWMPAGSAYAMTGPARHVWRHGIEAKKTDIVDGKSVPRGIRYSLTYRTVLH